MQCKQLGESEMPSRWCEVTLGVIVEQEELQFSAHARAAAAQQLQLTPT
jgi:hypothetical protein